jgi:hypothetical protein
VDAPRKSINCALIIQRVGGSTIDLLSSQEFFWLAGVRPGNVNRLLPLEQHLWQLFALRLVVFLAEQLAYRHCCGL